jgi:hypothetical protein
MELVPVAKDDAMLREAGGPTLVDRTFLEESMTYWERALATTLPDIRAEAARDASFVALEEVLTAPRTEALDVAPREVYFYDGFIPLSQKDLTATLSALVRQATHTTMTLAYDGVAPTEAVAAARVYVFAEPVTAVKGVTGRLLTAEGDVWQPGTPAAILVEIIEATASAAAEPVREQLVCRVEGGQVARWKKA